MAELIQRLVPSVEMVRMVNSGTEATMAAVRLARAFTGREKIIKFEGCYHGHGDSFLVKAGSGALTLGVPDSPGVPAAVAAATLTAGFNDLPSVEQLCTVQRGCGRRGHRRAGGGEHGMRPSRARIPGRVAVASVAGRGSC